jgi:hypothetical protein
MVYIHQHAPLFPERFRLQLKTIKLIFAVFPLRHTALRSKSKDWLNRNHIYDNFSECKNYVDEIIPYILIRSHYVI